MNVTKKNVVIVGFNPNEQKLINVPCIEYNKTRKKGDYLGFVKYINSLDELNKSQGFLIIIKVKKDIDLIKFDIKYRNRLNKFVYVWLYNESFRKYKQFKWANYSYIDDELFDLSSLNYWDMYDTYKLEKMNPNKIHKLTIKRRERITEIYNFIKNYTTITTRVIANTFSINNRMVERYMNDINDIYHVIGYDKSKNEWYIVKR